MRMMQLKAIDALIAKNNELRKENRQLKARVAELEESIKQRNNDERTE